MKTTLYVCAYLIAIVAANISLATFGPSVAALNAFLFIGFDFISRDVLQDAWQGQHALLRSALLISAGSVLSFVLDGAAGTIAIASCVSFAVSMALDTVIYTYLRRHQVRWLKRANSANVVSAAADSLIFPSLAFGALLPAVIVAQFIAKIAGGAFWSYVVTVRNAHAVLPDTPA